MKIPSLSFASRAPDAARLLFTSLLLLATSSAIHAAAPALAMSHFEFDDFQEFGGQSHDYLVWNGSADYWNVFQWQPGGFTKFLGQADGKDQFGRRSFVTQFEASPGVAPTIVAHYAVIGYASNGSILTSFSNTVSNQELLSDPGFKEGANSSGWAQKRTPTGGDQFNTNFIADLGGLYPFAVLGGEPSTSDVIYTSNNIFIARPTDVSVGTLAAFAISGTISVTTNEDPNETNAYDTLTMEIVDVNTAAVIYSTRLADNTWSAAGLIRFSTFNELKFQNFDHRTVRVVFRADNDVILGTTFVLGEIEFNLSFN